MRNGFYRFFLIALSSLFISCGEGGSGGGSGSATLQEEEGSIISASSLQMPPPENPSTVMACITNYGANPSNPNQNIIFLNIKFNFKPSEVKRLLGALKIKVDATGRGVLKWARYEKKVRVKINGQTLSGEGLEGHITDRRFQPSSCPAAAPIRNTIEASLDYHLPRTLQGQSLRFQFFVVDTDGQEFPLTQETTYSQTMIESSQSCETVVEDQYIVNHEKALHQNLDFSPLRPQ